MTKWQYGTAIYHRKRLGTRDAVIEIGNGTLPMEGFAAGDLLHISSFLKAAGEKGWELMTIMQPFRTGQELPEGDQHEGRSVVADPADVQWMIFKLPKG